MKILFGAPVALSLAIGMVTIAAPADAQGAKSAQQDKARQAKSTSLTVDIGGRKMTISAEARNPIAELQAAVNAGDNVAVAAKLAAANAVAKTSGDKYIIGQLHLQHAIKISDQGQQAAAIDALIASGAASADELTKLQRNAAALAARSGDKAKAAAALAQVSAANPNDPDALVSLAAIKIEQKQPAEALTLLNRAIAAKKAAGQVVPEAWYKNALQLTYDANMRPQALQLSREVLAAYPTQANWRNGLLIFRQGASQDPGAQLDTLRLMRAAKALETSSEYLALADMLDRGKFYAEAKAVIDEGVRAGKIPAGSANIAPVLARVSRLIPEDRAVLPSLEAKSRASGAAALKLADAYYGHGDYAKAAEFYRVALQKGGVDAPLVNTRLGMALAQAGRKAEAEAAFKAVSGPRAELANYWVAWLNQRG